MQPLQSINTYIVQKQNKDENLKESKPSPQLLQRSNSDLRNRRITLSRSSSSSSQPLPTRQRPTPTFSTQRRRVLPSMSLFESRTRTQETNQSAVGFPYRKQKNEDSYHNVLFQEIDTPISKLPNDCLLAIFQYLTGFDDYCTMMSVCQRWRRLASQPHLWKTTQFEYTHFSRQLAILHKPHRSFQQLHFIQQLTITNKEASDIESALKSKCISIKPFQHVRELCLVNMNIPDIRKLVLWLKDTLQTLTCRRIRSCNSKQTHAPLQSFDLRIFSGLYQLQHLFIEFAEPVVLSSIQVSLFPLSIPNPEKKLPSTLKTFSMINVSDYEHQLFGRADRDYIRSVTLPLNEEQERKINMMLDRWIASENHLLTKYQAFGYLSNLTSLTLDCVCSFTAKVWRQCYKPIAGKLTYLSLSRWQGKGVRDSPTTILNKRRLAEPNTTATGATADRSNDGHNTTTTTTPTGSTTPLDIHIDDVEMALSDFITSLVCIKEMRLDRFMCDSGLIDGLRNLRKPYKLEYDGVPTEEQDIRVYRDCQLNKFKITFES